MITTGRVISTIQDKSGGMRRIWSNLNKEEKRMTLTKFESELPTRKTFIKAVRSVKYKIRQSN